MTEGIIVLFGIGVVVVWVSYLVRESGNLRKDWRQAAGDAGLHLTDEKTWGLVGMVGRAGEHRVLIDELRTRQGMTGTRIVIEGSSGITLSRETWNTAFEKKLGKREMQLGDEAFDREVHVLGSPEVVRALLDAEAREQLRRMLWGWIRIDGGSTPGFEAEVSLSDGHLQAEFRAHWNEKLRVNLAEVLAALLAVARKLEPAADLAARIAQNTRTEPEWRVRVQNLIMLAESYPEHAATHEALKRACQDEDDDVRLRAALSLKDEGRETLLEIATRESAADGCVATAIAALGEHLAVDIAVSVLDGALRRKRTETVLACLAALGRRGAPTAVERLAKVLAEETPDFAVAAARALGASGAADAEARLQEALEEDLADVRTAPLLQALRGDLADVQTAAAEALGRIGSASAVLPLKEIAAREGADGKLKRAVRQAVAEIQSRLQGASPGQLSIAEGETGQLSLADEDPAGRISLPEPRKDP